MCGEYWFADAHYEFDKSGADEAPLRSAGLPKALAAHRSSSSP
jgi:hypothetical protein